MLKNKKKKGFTLIELIVVIAILGILAAVLIPRFGGFQDKARGTQALTDAKQLATAIDSFQAESKTGAWPVEGTDNTTIMNLAGVTSGGILKLGSNGDFTYEITLASKTYTAGRQYDATNKKLGPVEILSVTP